MQKDKLVIVVQRLIEGTKQQKVDWQRESRSGVFVVSFPNYSISLQKKLDEDDFNSSYIELSIYNNFGELVEVAYPWSLEPMGLTLAHSQLERLYESARRRAMGVENALEELLSELPKSEAEEQSSDKDDE